MSYPARAEGLVNRVNKVRSLPNESPGYDTKRSDGEVQVMIELCEMWSTPPLPSLPGLLWSGVVELDWVPSKYEIELKSLLMLKWTASDKTVCQVNCVLMLNWTVWNRTVFAFETVTTLYWIAWNRTVLTFNCLWTKSILVQNWIVLNRTVWLNWIAWNRNVFDN